MCFSSFKFDIFILISLLFTDQEIRPQPQGFEKIDKTCTRLMWYNSLSERETIRLMLDGLRTCSDQNQSTVSCTCICTTYRLPQKVFQVIRIGNACSTINLQGLTKHCMFCSAFIL